MQLLRKNVLLFPDIAFLDNDSVLFFSPTCMASKNLENVN